MTSLYKRATPSQAAILRIVEGACKNATDAHPMLEISPRHRRSIAKRAAGTLTANWPDVLAAKNALSSARAQAHFSKPKARRSQLCKAASREGGPVTPFPVRRLIAEIAKPLSGLKANGQHDRAEAFIEVLKMIDRILHD